MKEKKRCHSCRFLYTRFGGFGKCWYNRRSDSPDKRACRRYSPGVPYLPKIDGKLAKLITFDPANAQSWVWYTSSTQLAVLAWTTDIAGRQCWEIKLVGLRSDGGLHTKKFASECPAFFGEVMAMGAGQNSLWTSYGYEDEDQLDEDGVVKNKVRVVRLYPVEARKKNKGGHYDRK